MDPQVQQSFIPKKPLVGEASRAGTGLLTLIAVILFVLSVAAGAGVFLYGAYLESAIADKDASLKKAEGAFDTRSIQELERLDARLTHAQKLLDTHVAPSGLFAFLSAATLERVQFTSLDVDIGEGGSGRISMTGNADSFSTLALQSDQFSAAQVLRNVIFSGITTDTSGRVAFTVTADVDPSVMNYEKVTMPETPAQ